MDKEALVTVTVEENCEYQSSTASRKIALPQQLVQVNLKNPINMENNRPNGVFCYDDKIKLEASVTYKNNNTVFVQTGRIEFYFIPEGTKTEILINKSEISYTNAGEPDVTQTCELNKNGTAAVIFKPTSSGKIFARYVDDNEIYATADSEEQSLIIQSIPVKIEFCSLPPYITNIHDEITIKVHVTNAYDNTNVKYGLVTFLHYLTKDDTNTPNKRVPDVIGNPVPVFDGYAEISYIPVQSDDYGYTNPNNDTEPEILKEETTENTYAERYVEYIKASYNYSGKYIDTDKGDYRWQYYNTNSKWTAISVLARNTININPPQVNNTVLSLNGEKGIYQCQESDTIKLSAILKDKNNQTIDFSNNYTGVLTFHIKGTHAHPKGVHTPNGVPEFYSDDYTQTSEEFNFLTYEKDIDATWSNGQFVATIQKPLPGFYSVSATTTIMTQESDLPLIDYGGAPQNIENDKKYAQVTDSNVIYISSKYTDINYTINLTHDTYFNQTQEKLNNLSGNVLGLTNNQMNILHNKPCYFYAAETNNTYTGKLTYNSNTNKLVGEPSQDIIFDTPNDYHIYMYIPSGIYTNNTAITTYHHNITSSAADSVYDFFLPYYSSIPITIQIRDAIELELSIDTISNAIPAEFSYNLVGKYVNNEVTIDLFAKAINSSVENKIIDGIELFKQYHTATDIFEINQANEYEIYARSRDGIESNKITIEVKKENLTQILLESSKEMFASIDNTIGVYLTSQVNDINLIKHDKIHAFLYDNNKSNQQSINIKSNQIINDKTIYLELEPQIWKEGAWYIKITYDGDNNFAQYNGIFEQFISVLDTPTVKLTPYNNNYMVDVTSPHFNPQASNIIIVPVIFNKNNSKVGEGIYISHKDGSGGFNDHVDNHNTISWWDEWNNIVFIFDPYNSSLIQLLKSNNPPYDALKSTYGHVFDESQITDEADLYWQLHDNNDKYIFDTYKPTQIRVARPTSL